MAVRILVIQEAEATSQDLLRISALQGYQVHSTELKRPEGLLFMVPPDLVILNVRHVGPETRFLCQEICRQTRNLMLPLMLLTETSDETGLPHEPEACLVRPLSIDEIGLVISLLTQDRTTHILAAGGLHLDLDTHQVQSRSSSHHLSPKQFTLLETFLRHPASVLTRRFLMREVWDTDFVLDTRTLDVHIHWIRKKIEPDPSKPRYLRTVRGVGYYFVPALLES
jgi:DNA-binding response OmpR family regulator